MKKWPVGQTMVKDKKEQSVLPPFIILEITRLPFPKAIISRKFKIALVDKKHNCELDHTIITIPSNITARNAINRYCKGRLNAYKTGIAEDLL